MKKVVVVTGGSAGIGKAFVCDFSKRGYQVIAIARRQKPLDDLVEELSSFAVIPIQADLCSEKDRQDVYKKLEAFDIDILINNVGCTSLGVFGEKSLEEDLQTVQTNIHVTLDISHWFLKKKQAKFLSSSEKKESSLVILSSFYNFVPVQRQSVYAGSKAFLSQWGLSVGLEARSYAVSVTVVYPGKVETSFVNSHKGWKILTLSPKQVVQATRKAIKQRRLQIVVGWQYKMFVFLSKVFPKTVARVTDCYNRIRGV